MLGMVTFGGLLAGWIFCWVSERVAHPAVPPQRPAEGITLDMSVVVARIMSGQTNGLVPKRFWLHLGVALMSAAMFGYLWGRFNLSWDMLRLAGCFGFLVVLSLIDLKSRRVPNYLVYPAIVITLLFKGLVSPQALAEAGVGGGMAFLIFYLTAWMRPGDLGGGDIKLATLIGIGFGFPRMVWALLVGAVVGGAVAVSLLLIWRRSAKSRIPYAPFLCLGAWVALVYNPIPWPLH